MAVFQLIYLSDLVAGQEGQIPAILESAVRHNGEDGITGMLLFSRGNFLQVLEGEEARVRATFERISKDPRHRNLVVLTEETVPERHFSHWSMGYRQLSPEEVGRFPRFAPYFQFGFQSGPLAAKPGVALEMLEMFRQGAL